MVKTLCIPKSGDSMRKYFLLIVILLLSAISIYGKSNLSPYGETEEELVKHGDECYKNIEYDEAVAYYNQALKINPKNVKALTGKAYALYSLTSPAKEVLSFFDKALAIDPSNEKANLGKANCLRTTEHFKESIVYYDKVLKVNGKNMDALNGKAESLRYLGKDKEAMKCYEKAEKINPSGVDWAGKGELLYKQKKYEKAILCFNKYLNDYKFVALYDPYYDVILNKKGNALYELGRYEEALECYEELLKINPGNKEAKENKKKVLDKF